MPQVVVDPVDSFAIHVAAFGPSRSTTAQEPDLGRDFAREAGQEGYLGLPIVGREGCVIGHLSCVHGRSLAGDDVLLESVYRIVTARAGVEIELDQALKRLESAVLAA